MCGDIYAAIIPGQSGGPYVATIQVRLGGAYVAIIPGKTGGTYVATI
jgi:hypothetical protein